MKPIDQKNFKNILVVRTDRIGDVVLTTPVISSLRKAYPSSRITMLVSAQTKEIVEENLLLDEVIIDDPYNENKGFFGFWRLVGVLRQRGFTLAINYHLKKRTNFLLFHANIPYRVGFQNKKFGFLLTHQFPDPRTDGLLHETEYCLKLLEYIGLKPGLAQLHVTVKKDCEAWVEKVLQSQGIGKAEKIFLLHPGASCPSKRWPPENFALVADSLQKEHKKQCILIGSLDSQDIANKVCENAKVPLINLVGKTTVGQLISLIKRSDFLISNDSGPAHLAASLETPVVSVFGRNQKGLSVTRWKPLGNKSRTIHKDSGCLECKAHECQKDFRCLRLISTDDVLKIAQELLS